MNQNKILLPVLSFVMSMIFFAGCAPDEKVLWLKSQVSKYELEKERFNVRSPAQSAPRCFTDRFQDSLILREVQKMEAEYAGGKRGSYQHGDMQFKDLPQATIDLLSSNYLLQPEVTGTQGWTAIDPKQRDCKDYSCFINALYANPTNEGLLQYWHFLKTGYPVSAVKAYSLYDASAKKTKTEVLEGAPLEQYLFNKDEWKAFWLTTHLLPSSMLHVPSISAIHRLPRGFLPPSWKTSGICGWAVGYWSQGEIVLSDGCLTLSKTNIFDKRAFFYEATTHEMAHALSGWNFATKVAPQKKIAEEPEFLDLSGWKVERLIQPNGSYISQWKNNGDAAEWASLYSRTNPDEDFAEVVAHYRTDPTYLHSHAPTKYDYAKKKVFGGRGYFSTDLKERYSDQIKDGVIKYLEDWIASCLKGKEGSVLPEKLMALSKVIDVKIAVDPKIKSCIQKQVVATIGSELDRIRYDEPEGCNAADAFGAEINTAAVEKLLPDLNEYLKTYEKLTELIGGVKLFRSALVSSFDGRALVLMCAQAEDPVTCYETKLSTEFDRLYQANKVLLSPSAGDIAEIERKRFLRVNSYENLYGETVQFYESLFATSNEEIKSRADLMWKACLAVPSRVNTNVLLTPYSAGVQYVSPAVIQCLNEKLPEEMSAIRIAAGKAREVNITSPEARAWVTQRILLPRFKTILDSKVVEASRAEVVLLSELKTGAIDSSYQNMIDDLSWKKNEVDTYVECKTAVNSLLQQKLKTDSYRFTATDPIVDELGTQVCEKIRSWLIANENARSRTSTDEVQVVQQGMPVPTDAQKKELDSIWKKLLPFVLAEAETRFDHCRSRTYFAQRLKRFCLFNEWVVDDQDQYRKNAWGWTKDRAIRKWMADAGIKAFMASKGYTEAQLTEIAKARAEDDRQELADAILRRFYGANGEESP